MLGTRNWLLIGIAVVFLGAALTFLAGAQCEEHPNEVLGEAQIVVYEKGERIILDTKSPYLEELQLTCEEMLELREHVGEGTAYEGWTVFPGLVLEISGDLPMVDNPVALEVRDNEYSIELIYERTQYLYVKAEKRPTAFSHLLIPMTGEFAHQLYEGASYLCLIPLLSSQEYQDYYRSTTLGIATTRDVQKLKEILRQFNIEVP